MTDHEMVTGVMERDISVLLWKTLREYNQVFLKEERMRIRKEQRNRSCSLLWEEKEPFRADCIPSNGQQRVARATGRRRGISVLHGAHSKDENTLEK
jgi:hypothetical protein